MRVVLTHGREPHLAASITLTAALTVRTLLAWRSSITRHTLVATGAYYSLRPLLATGPHTSLKATLTRYPFEALEASRPDWAAQSARSQISRRARRTLGSIGASVALCATETTVAFGTIWAALGNTHHHSLRVGLAVLVDDGLELVVFNLLRSDRLLELLELHGNIIDGRARVGSRCIRRVLSTPTQYQLISQIPYTRLNPETQSRSFSSVIC